jgi:hypothetical protein
VPAERREQIGFVIDVTGKRFIAPWPNVAGVAAVRNQHTTMTTLSDLQATAIEFYRARVTIICETIRNPPERGRRLAALARQFEARDEYNGVRVEVIVPQYRMVYRQPHFRFRYVAGGKQVSEATARALVEG